MLTNAVWALAQQGESAMSLKELLAALTAAQKALMDGVFNEVAG